MLDDETLEERLPDELPDEDELLVTVEELLFPEPPDELLRVRSVLVTLELDEPEEVVPRFVFKSERLTVVLLLVVPSRVAEEREMVLLPDELDRLVTPSRVEPDRPTSPVLKEELRRTSVSPPRTAELLLYVDELLPGEVDGRVPEDRL